MPVLPESSYRAPPGFDNGHLQTIHPVLFRKVPVVTTERERIETADGDFLDLDWDTSNASNRLVIISHGLEGDSRDHYVQAMAAAVQRSGGDTLAWNFRGCSGEPNLLLRSYHSGATEDLLDVMAHAKRTRRYSRIDLIGFSMGGNLVLKLLGDLGSHVDPILCRAVAFSVPCDLASASHQLENVMNSIYMERFLQGLRKKVRGKMVQFPNEIHDDGLDKMRSFREFDAAYTAPLHGFRSAEDYWLRASSKPVLPQIAIPTLLVSARNDPFLAPPCYPIAEAEGSSCFFLESPRSGGHLGFVTFNSSGEFWSETRAMEFLNEA